MSNTLRKPAAQPAKAGDGRSLALRHAEEAFHILLGIMRDATAGPATRLRAAAAVIERAWGRVGAAAKAAVASPPLPVNFVNAPDMSREEWIQRFGRLGEQPKP